MMGRILGGVIVAGAVMFGGALTALAGDQDFDLANVTGYTIDEVYVSPSDSDDWGSDVMGRDTLGDGESVHITFHRDTDACKWDVMIVFDDKSKARWSNIDLCKVSTVKVHYDRNSDRTWAEVN